MVEDKPKVARKDTLEPIETVDFSKIILSPNETSKNESKTKDTSVVLPKPKVP